MLDPEFFTRLGVPWLWGGDVEKAWVFMRFNVVPITAMVMAPGSYAYGTDRIPLEGGAVLAVNHLAAIDPPLVGSYSTRAVWYMMKSELLEIPVAGEALTWTGAFPIRRGESDRDGMRKAFELVREGHVVGIFAEGTRQRFGYPGPVHAGAATIAMKEDVPVIPCGVESSAAKAIVSEYATEAADRGIQILGGMGYSAEYQMQRYWRDVRLYQIGPVTNQMVRNIVAESVGLPRSF